MPHLKFTYSASTLRVDCNEVGFSASNVEAICSIRRSTKSGRDHAGRTGEKGIGFKSVFKIADMVWLSSLQYTFKFDKALDFGIIAPIWAEFPLPVLEGHTSYLLQLARSCDEHMIIESLLNFNHTCLLFLRRIRLVTLNVTTDNQLRTIEIRRRDETDANGPVKIVEYGEQTFTYIIARQCLDNLPKEPKRPGITESELLLAFPEIKAQEHESSWNTQNVHSVLPIGNYGLKVLLLSVT